MTVTFISKGTSQLRPKKCRKEEDKEVGAYSY